MSDGYSVTQDGAMGRLTFERPEKGNLLTLSMLTHIANDIRDAASTGVTNALVVRGRGNDFCLGRDPDGAPEGKSKTALEMRKALIEPILGVYSAIRDAEVPVVTGVQGLANGLGCGITAISDVSIAADNAQFAMPEMRANLPPTLAMLAHLDRIPPKSLLGMVYSTDKIDATRAVSIGLISDVVTLDKLDNEIESLLDKLAAYERASVVTCKSYLKGAKHADYPTANDLAGNLLSVVLSSRK